MSQHPSGIRGVGAAPDRQRTYDMLAKPVSDVCNLRCEYCYYTSKHQLLGMRSQKMSRATLKAFTRQNLEMHGADASVEFAWHGGEPLVAGIGFFREALRLQARYGRGRRIINTVQTNATLLTDEFCRLFKDNGFLVGVSIDGPEALHDLYRKDARGHGSFDAVMRGIGLLERHGIAFSTLTTVNRANMAFPLEVYRFLRSLTDHIQFLPVVERAATRREAAAGQGLAQPPGIGTAQSVRPVTDFSVTPEGYGSFLCAVFDEWQAHDRGTKHVQMIDVALGNLKGGPSTLCVHNPLCGHSGCVEANGDIFACDRYAYPAYRLGNIAETPLGELMEGNRAFGMHKAYGLPDECFDCPYLRLCFGGCPKDRLAGARNYLCEGYRMFFAKLTAVEATERGPEKGPR